MPAERSESGFDGGRLTPVVRFRLRRDKAVHLKLLAGFGLLAALGLGCLVAYRKWRWLVGVMGVVAFGLFVLLVDLFEEVMSNPRLAHLVR